MIMSLLSLSILLSIMVSFSANVFSGLIYAVCLFINATAILLSLGFEFLAVVNVLVYVGALAVLFVFVIMLCDSPSSELRSYYSGIAHPFIILPMLYLFYNLCYSSDLSYYALIITSESISSIGHAFYIRYADVLIMNSLILTIALFGALTISASTLSR